MELFPTCPLCLFAETSPLSPVLEDRYFHCTRCDFRFLHPKYRLDAAEEKKRYLSHNNDITDPRYQAFVRPLYDAIVSRLPENAEGLDFGAGTGPVLGKMLEARGNKISFYDPFFWPDDSVLQKTYDFIFACEVVEHLFEPHKEFQRLKTMLRAGGTLAIMTLLFPPQTDFSGWHYRKDPTHVGFFSEKSVAWLTQAFGFANFWVIGDRVLLLN